MQSTFLILKPELFNGASKGLVDFMNEVDARGEIVLIVPGVCHHYTRYDNAAPTAPSGYKVGYDADWNTKEGGAGPADAVVGALRYNQESDIIAMTRAAALEIERRQEELEAQREADRKAEADRLAVQQRDAALREALCESLNQAKFKRKDVVLDYGRAGRGPTTNAVVHGGIAVHKSLSPSFTQARAPRYSISHAENGLLLIDGFASQQDAKLAAARLARLGDISRLSQDTVKTESFVQLRQVALAIKKTAKDHTIQDPLANPEIDAPHRPGGDWHPFDAEEMCSPR